MLKKRILIAKAGLDGHDRGAKVIVRGLRDAGFEVIYTGLHQTVDMIVKTAIEEDVNAIGLSILSGAHMTLFPMLLEKLKAKKLENILIFGGGIIPEEDIEDLKKLGVSNIFTPGAKISEIVNWLESEID